MKIKVFEVREEKPLSAIEGLMEKFMEDAEKAGKKIDVESISHFESTFHKTHGAMILYDETVVAKPQEKPHAAPNPPVSTPSVAPAGEASGGGAEAGAPSFGPV